MKNKQKNNNPWSRQQLYGHKTHAKHISNVLTPQQVSTSGQTRAQTQYMT